MPTVRRASAHKEPAGASVPSRLSAGSWILYDVSNTIFFAGVTGIFFPLWVVNDMGGSDATIGFTVAGAMLANLLVAPVFGAMSDGARRRLPFLAVLSMVAIASTFLLGTLGLSASLALFGVSLVAMHTAVVVYNALLVEVSTEANRGLIGGIGVGVGYLGALLAVAIGLTLAEDQGYVMAFRAVGAIMLVLTLPVVFLLRERPREARGGAGRRRRPRRHLQRGQGCPGRTALPWPAEPAHRQVLLLPGGPDGLDLRLPVRHRDDRLQRDEGLRGPGDRRGHRHRLSPAVGQAL